jgi:ATP-dependent DNA helicase RecG
MVNLKMIDTQGYGIHGMFLRQKESYLPMPDYNKSTTNKVILTLPGRVINRNYSLMLMNKTDMDLTTAYLLDKVQKGEYISDEAAYTLRRQKLIEGRKPKYIVGQVVAQITHKEAEYTNLKGFDEQYYLDLITHALEQHGSLKRADFNKLLIKKLPEVLSEPQKIKKVSNLLSKLKRDAKIDVGKDKVWHLVSKQG